MLAAPGPVTHICLPIQRPNNDPPHSLKLDFVRALLQGVAQFGRGGALQEIIVDDGVTRRGRVHVGRGDLSYLSLLLSPADMESSRSFVLLQAPLSKGMRELEGAV